MDYTKHDPRVARSLFEQAYADYLKSINQIGSDYLASCEETCLSYLSALERLATDAANQHREAQKDYHTALLGDYKMKEQVSEESYVRYMHAILRSWDFEKALQQSKCAHEEYREALTKCADAASIEQAQSTYAQQLNLAWTAEIDASCVDTYNEHVQVLANAWTIMQRCVAEAHRDYLHEVQKAWAVIETNDVDDDCLAEIGKNMTSVALYPVLGAAPWQSSVPAFSKVAGDS